MVKRPPKKPKYMERADKSFSKYIRNRDGCCQKCGTTEFLQCAHIISRSYKAIRVDERNAVALCRSEHTYFTHRPLEWVEWVEDNYPGRWAELKKEALEYGKVDWRFQSIYWAERVKQQEAEL